jgi:dTDP-glucose 4,6-dehydratase|tara:strand:- start:764 stop:1696 length:933 start_codon:yes stop_codon:yes gene_type:complete
MLLVTGGAGFIGSNFLHYLRKVTDEKVLVVDNLTYAADLRFVPEDPQFEFLWCDITNEKHVNHVFKKYKPKKIFHFAAESHVDNSIKNYRPFLEANVVGTINLLNASLLVDVDKFHHISTDEVYGSLELDSEDIFTEQTPYDPKNPYSASKAASDHFVGTWHNTYGLPYLITNCSNNYGYHQHVEKLIPKVIFRALKNEVTYMYGGGHQIRDWLWVEDHCRAIWMLEEQGILNDRFNIGGDCELPNRTVAEEILTYMGKSFELIGVSDERPGQDLRYGMSFDKLKRRTGWEPLMSFDDGLRKTIDWYLAR